VWKVLCGSGIESASVYSFSRDIRRFYCTKSACMLEGARRDELWGIVGIKRGGHICAIRAFLVHYNFSSPCIAVVLVSVR